MASSELQEWAKKVRGTVCWLDEKSLRVPLNWYVLEDIHHVMNARQHLYAGLCRGRPLVVILLHTAILLAPVA